MSQPSLTSLALAKSPSNVSDLSLGAIKRSIVRPTTAEVYPLARSKTTSSPKKPARATSSVRRIRSESNIRLPAGATAPPTNLQEVSDTLLAHWLRWHRTFTNEASIFNMWWSIPLELRESVQTVGELLEEYYDVAMRCRFMVQRQRAQKKQERILCGEEKGEGKGKEKAVLIRNVDKTRSKQTPLEQSWANKNEDDDDIEDRKGVRHRDSGFESACPSSYGASPSPPWPCLPSRSKDSAIGSEPTSPTFKGQEVSPMSSHSDLADDTKAPSEASTLSIPEEPPIPNKGTEEDSMPPVNPHLASASSHNPPTREPPITPERLAQITTALRSTSDAVHDLGKAMYELRYITPRFAHCFYDDYEDDHTTTKVGDPIRLRNKYMPPTSRRNVEEQAEEERAKERRAEARAGERLAERRRILHDTIPVRVAEVLCALREQTPSFALALGVNLSEDSYSVFAREEIRGKTEMSGALPTPTGSDSEVPGEDEEGGDDLVRRSANLKKVVARIRRDFALWHHLHKLGLLSDQYAQKRYASVVQRIKALPRDASGTKEMKTLCIRARELVAKLQDEGFEEIRLIDSTVRKSLGWGRWRMKVRDGWLGKTGWVIRGVKWLESKERKEIGDFIS